ncbi:MAG: hypothetical protein ACLTSL_03820 [Odoribacter splanchnicus]
MNFVLYGYVDYYVANPVVKKALVRNCTATYFRFGKGSDYMKFWDRFQTFAGDYPKVIRDGEEWIVGICRMAKGIDAGDAVLYTQDGKTYKFRSLLVLRLSAFLWMLIARCGKQS